MPTPGPLFDLLTLNGGLFIPADSKIVDVHVTISADNLVKAGKTQMQATLAQKDVCLPIRTHHHVKLSLYHPSS